MTYERQHADWLKGYIDYASFGEAPKKMHFWSGVSAIAGALRRKVWIEQQYFRWYANFYIIFVAPPGIVSKSTTAGIAMDLLKRVPGVKFGPAVVTWPALVCAFAECGETFPIADTHYEMSAMTLESSELGNLLNPQDKDMVDLLVTLWDGKQGAFEKKTKHSGNDQIKNPWINLIGCTTPSWIAGNFPEYVIGGGFTSRCVFVYAEKKSRYVAYLEDVVPPDLAARSDRLVADLEHISLELAGPYALTKDAKVFGRQWYEDHFKNKPVALDDDRFGGYIARKQTHIHKLAMILAAAKSDRMEIDATDLAVANEMVTDLEEDMTKVFSKIGRTDVSVHADRLLAYIRKSGTIKYEEAYRFVHVHFPSMRDFEDTLMGCIKAGYIRMDQKAGEIWLTPSWSPPDAALPPDFINGEASAVAAPKPNPIEELLNTPIP